MFIFVFFFWFSELKQIGSATTNAKGQHQFFFCLCLFVICFAFLLEFACAFVCFFFFCVVVNITDIQDTKLFTNHDLVCMAHGWAASMYVWLQQQIHVLYGPLYGPCLRVSAFAAFFLSNRGSACEFVDVVTCVSFNQKLQFQTPNIICETKYSRISNMQELHNKLLIAQTV